jgi:hypothetical protein
MWSRLRRDIQRDWFDAMPSTKGMCHLERQKRTHAVSKERKRLAHEWSDPIQHDIDESVDPPCCRSAELISAPGQLHGVNLDLLRRAFLPPAKDWLAAPRVGEAK